MAHPYRIREIAAQAGLSEATVDRVLNRRGGVRASTVQEVHRAVADLHRQKSQLRLGGRTFMIDVVMDAPERFSSAVRTALETELPSLRPAVIRSRFHLRETAPTADLVAILDRIASRGSQGVILKAPDVPEISAAVQHLVRNGIPIVTLVTDLPSSPRLAYVGIDNRAAGATAAYLLEQWLGSEPGDVMVIRSSGFFRGEDEREMGFRGTMRATCPGRRQVDVIDQDGRDESLREQVRVALAADPTIKGVYSMYSIGGGNAAVVRAFAEAGRNCSVFIAHDLDDHNTALLQSRRLSAVLHHDLNQDMRRACHVIMQAHRALPGPILSWPSSIQVITPFNVPAPAPHA
jgi:LacI family transcriptional regulator